jgi:hypothetical protein
MSDIETETDILLLAAAGDERKAKSLLREMSPEEWRLLREVCSRLDEWLDDIVFEKYQGRRRNDSQ